MMLAQQMEVASKRPDGRFEMGRKYLRVPPYPPEGPWKETSFRCPEWMRAWLQKEAQQQRIEGWVVLLDKLARAGAVPRSTIPELHSAVTWRYGTDLRPDGIFGQPQLALTLAAESAEQNKADDDEAEADEAAHRAPKRSSRTRDSGSSVSKAPSSSGKVTSAGSMFGLSRKHRGK